MARRDCLPKDPWTSLWWDYPMCGSATDQPLAIVTISATTVAPISSRSTPWTSNVQGGPTVLIMGWRLSHPQTRRVARYVRDEREIYGKLHELWIAPRVVKGWCHSYDAVTNHGLKIGSEEGLTRCTGLASCCIGWEPGCWWVTNRWEATCSGQSEGRGSS